MNVNSVNFSGSASETKQTLISMLNVTRDCSIYFFVRSPFILCWIFILELRVSLFNCDEYTQTILFGVHLAKIIFFSFIRYAVVLSFSIQWFGERISLQKIFFCVHWKYRYYSKFHWNGLNMPAYDGTWAFTGYNIVIVYEPYYPWRKPKRNQIKKNNQISNFIKSVSANEIPKSIALLIALGVTELNFSYCNFLWNTRHKINSATLLAALCFR